MPGFWQAACPLSDRGNPGRAAAGPCQTRPMPSSSPSRPGGLSTGRPDLVLRPPAPADADDVRDAVRASLAELRPWMPWAGDDYSADDARSWIRGDFGDFCAFVIVHEGRVAEKSGAVLEGIRRAAVLHPSGVQDAWVWSFVQGDRVRGRPVAGDSR